MGHGNVGGGPGQEDRALNGRIIDPIALEQRLGRIEAAIGSLDQKFDQWTKSHEAWGISQNMQSVARLDALQEAIVELKTSNAVCNNQWINHKEEHAQHEKQHEAMTRKERQIDVIVGVVSSAVAFIMSWINPGP